MFIVLHDADGYIDVREGISLDSFAFGTLEEALSHIRDQSMDLERDISDYTVFKACSVAITLSLKD